MTTEPVPIGLAAVAAAHPGWSVAVTAEGCVAHRRGKAWFDDWTPALPVRLAAPSADALECLLAFWDALEAEVSA
ncbi:MAG: hypothetical protein J2P30_06640 [Actinobacteria bacterium]|nr:hypothetical protein [Actinomycetota bacterium]